MTGLSRDEWIAQCVQDENLSLAEAAAKCDRLSSEIAERHRKTRHADEKSFREAMEAMGGSAPD